MRQSIERLTDDLAEYLANSYFMDSAFRAFQRGGAPLPTDYSEWAKREDLLYNKIRLRLNPHERCDAELLQSLTFMRDTDTDVLWIDRRDQVVATAQRAFAEQWRLLLLSR